MADQIGVISRRLLLAGVACLMYACQSGKNEIVKASFADLVYYSGSVDLYFKQAEAEQRYRISTDEALFGSVIEQFTSKDELGEGPPSYNQKLVGSWYCLTLVQGTITRINSPDTEGDCK